MRVPGLEQTLTGMTVGIDSRNDIPEGITTLGAFMGTIQALIALRVVKVGKLPDFFLKKRLFLYAGYHHFIMMSLVSGEHNTPALSLQDESPGLVPAG